MGLPLDEAALFDLMAPCEDEFAAYDAEVEARAKEALEAQALAPEKWEWMKTMPVPEVPARRGKSEFQAYLQRYIDDMAKLRQDFGPDFVLPPDHIASLLGEDLKRILDDFRLETRAPTTATEIEIMRQQYEREDGHIPSIWKHRYGKNL